MTWLVSYLFQTYKAGFSRQLRISVQIHNEWLEMNDKKKGKDERQE